MYSNRLFWAPVNCAARNPTAKSRGSRELRDQACMLIVSPRKLTGNSAELLPWCPSNLRAIGKNLKLESRSPRTPQNPAGGQPPAQQKKAQTYFVWRCLLRLICRKRRHHHHKKKKKKKTSKPRVTGLCEGNETDRRVPRTKGQLREQSFHLITSLFRSFLKYLGLRSHQWTSLWR